MDYNKTINLPQTDFPMRAGLPAREPGMLAKWEEMDLYGEMLKKNEGKPRFSLHDGPPFSNGNIHMGTAMNKALKDFIVRMYAMRGRYTPYVPGWDNHGMPIESAIIKQNKLNRKKMSVPEFRSACHDFAQHYVDVQMASFKRIGVVGDWDHPYLTMNPGFEAEEVKVFGEMFKKGYIYKGLKPVYWCPKDETALAEAEIEYKDDPCTTVYVKFPMADDLGKLPGVDKDKLYFLIWTTTIWTLPGNLAIALHPEEAYALVKCPNGETYILAQALAEKVMSVGGVEGWEIIATYPGAFFENMLARHPFLDKTSRLVLADYVTMDSGTGCVHTAPGFGADDYQTCLRYGMEMVVPVDDQGRHTDYAGKYAGMTTDESNPAILADMKESGMLFASEDIVHSYPHCWRCKNPIIFRATPQWFCSVDAFKDQAVAACDGVRWVPAWGKDRMISMIRERADWCISRQRRWGLPIPVFYCQDCGKPICDDETIAAVSKLFGEKGSNAWYEMEAKDILPEGYRCPHCGGVHFTKEEDTLDGWFDSGSTHYASMKKDQGFWPADMYLEGLDQYRGWFQSSLLTAVGALGQGAPFKECLTHGWTVDGQGRAMHKSLPGQRRGPRRRDQEVRRGHPPPVGRQRRLPRGRPLLRRHLQTAQPELPEVPQHRPVLPGQPLRLRPRPPGIPGGHAGAGPLGGDPAQPAHRAVLCRLRQLRVPRGQPRRQRLLRGGAQLLLPGHHQGPPLLRGEGQPGAPQRPDRPVADPGHHDQALRPHPGLHLRRDLAGHAPPGRGRSPERAPQPDEPALCGLRPGRRRHGPLGPDHRRPGRRQRRAGAGPGGQDHRQGPGGPGVPHRPGGGRLPGGDGRRRPGGPAHRLPGGGHRGRRPGRGRGPRPGGEV